MSTKLTQSLDRRHGEDPQEAYLETAREYLAAGLSPIALRVDGSKAPIETGWQKIRADDAYLVRQFGNRERAAIGILCGAASGALEVLDIDRAELYELVIDCIERDAPGLTERLPIVRTGSGAYHGYYRHPVRNESGNPPGGTKLARRKTATDGEVKTETLIETRGHGHQVVAPGSHVDVHLAKRPYEHIAGPPLTETPTITAEERTIILKAARSFDQMPADESNGYGKQVLEPPPEDRNLPGDAFNRSGPVWSKILEPKGWVFVKKRGESELWRRPGKADDGWSAMTNHDGHDLLTVFSENGAPFEVWADPPACERRKNYTKFFAYALLYHGGNWGEASDWLEMKGYGTKKVDDDDEYPVFPCLDGEHVATKSVRKALQERHGDAISAVFKPPPPKTSDGDVTAQSSKALSVGYPAKVSRAMIAEKFTSNGVRTLARHGEEWQVWDSTAFHVVRDEDFKAASRNWLETKKLVKHRRVGKDLEAVPIKPNTNITNETIDATRAIANIPADVEQPSWLKPTPADPDPLDVIACSNGLYDIKTDKLVPHTPRWFSRNVLPFPWQPEATCETWEGFLWDVSCQNLEWVRALKMWFGYLLTSDTSQQKLMIFEGPPRSGKGVIIRAFQGVLGRFNYCNPTLSSMCERFGLESLVGKTSAIMADAHLGGRTDRTAVVERLKAITGEESVDVDRKHLPILSGVKLRVRFTLSVNQLVNLPDSSDAISSRCIILPFEKSHVGCEDLTLDSRIALEFSGILNWGFEGLRDLRDQKRLIQPEKGEATLEDLARLVSPLKTFVSDLCVVGPELEVTTQGLFRLWNGWCQENNHQPGANSGFGIRLQALVRSVERSRKRDGDRRIPIYKGISINRTAVHRAGWTEKTLEYCGFDPVDAVNEMIHAGRLDDFDTT